MTLLHPLIFEDLWDRTLDPWGSAGTVLSAICDVLFVKGGEIPPEVGYRPSPLVQSEADVAERASGDYRLQFSLLQAMHPERHPDSFVADMPRLDLEHLEYAALVLHHYRNVANNAGRSY